MNIRSFAQSRTSILLELMFFGIVILSTFAVAECSDKFPVTSEVLVERLVCNGEVINPPPLEVRNIRYINESNPCWVSFDVYNTGSVTVKASITSYTEATVNGSTSNVERVFHGAIIEPQKYQRLNEYVDGASQCRLTSDKVIIAYEKTSTCGMRNVLENVTLYQCLSCFSKKCTSGACYGGYCVQTCPNGTAVCNGVCSPVAIKEIGEPYICDFECRTRLGNPETGLCTACLNGSCQCHYLGSEYTACVESNTCIIPSSKNNGEAYSCIQECQSGYGRKGVCSVTPTQFLLRGAFVVLALSVLVMLIWNSQLRRDIENQVKNKTKIVAEKAQEKVKEAQEKVKVAETNAAKEIAQSKAKIDEVKRDLQKVTIEKIQAEEDYERTLAELKKKDREIRKQQQEIDEQKEVVHQKTEELAEETKKYLETEKQAEAYKKNYRRVVGSQTFILNDGGYECYQDTGKPYHYYVASGIYEKHRQWFEQNYPGMTLPAPYGNGLLTVHHIDKNKLNNEPTNLAIIPKKFHPNNPQHHDRGSIVNHSKILFGDKETGLRELERLGIFQPHISELRSK